MAREPSAAILDPLRRLITRQTGSSLSDAQLLESFIARRDPAAFEVLVWRHGAMVLALCQRVLRDAHEAEDAFQATFLVLARKAGAIGKAESVSCWLYKVAYRIAIRLRGAAKHAPEPLGEVPAPEMTDDAEWKDLRPVLDDEIARLPEKYRAPFVLCYLEGRTNEEAAAQLGCPKGTVLSRLSRGRERLRARLTRRGVALSVTALALALTRNAASAAAPPTILIHATTVAAVPFATGTAASELMSGRVATLTNGALQAMKFTHLKTAAVALLSLIVLGTGIGWAAFGTTEAPAARTEQIASNTAPTEPNQTPRERLGVPVALTLDGEVVEVAKDGASFTVETPPSARGEEPVKTLVKLSEKSAVKYYAVGVNGAKPTVGYEVEVQFERNSNGVAAVATFRGAGKTGRVADRVGVVTAVAKDGRSVTMEVRPEVRGDRGPERPKETIPFDDKTVFVYHQVGKDGAALTVGYTIRVFFADDGKTAGKVDLLGSAPASGPSRGKRDATDLTGTVRRASEDGKTFVVEVPAAERGAEPTRVTLKVGAKTVLSFSNTPTGGAKIATSLPVRVWLEKDSSDVVEFASFTGTVPERWPIVSGKIVAVANDGSSYTIEQPVAARGEGPRRYEIKLSAKTEQVYFAVGPDGAKPTLGYTANARFLDGSTDTAAKVTFSPPDDRGR